MEQAKNLKDAQAPSKDAPSPVVITTSPEATRRARDFLFYCGLVPVTGALGLALHLHLDLPPMMAAAIVLPTAICLLLAHKLQRRAQSLRALEGELAELRRVAPAARPGRDARPEAAMMAMPVRPSAGMSAMAGQPGAPARMSSNATAPTGTGLAPRAPSSMGPPVPASWDLPPPSLTGNIRGQPVPSTLPVAAAKPLPPVAAGSTTTPSMTPPSQTPAASGTQVAVALMGTYWGHRPGMQPEPTLTSPVTAFAAHRSSHKQPPEADAPRSGPPVGPTVPVTDLGPGPDERELETMQNLIQQLAVQLNAPKRPEKIAEKPSETGLSEKVAAIGAVVGTPEQFEAVKVEPVEPETDKSDVGLTASAGSTESESGKPAANSSETAKAEATVPALDAVSTAEANDSADATVSDSVAALRAAATTMRQEPETSAVPGNRAPAVPPPLPPASRYGELARVTEAVAANRIDVYLDPILGLNDRKARLFEVSVRVLSSDGDVLDPAAIREIASGTGLLARIDAAKLARSARVAGRLTARGTNASLYSNLASESLADDVFLDTLEDAIATEADLPKRLVLSFTQADVRAFNDVHWETVATMAEIGLRFALEDVADLDMDFEKLKSSGFEFVKLDAPVFLDGLPAADGAIPAADLCRHLSGHGLSLIVGAIEDEMSLAKVLGFGVLFGQGTIFGGPRAVQLDPLHQQTAAA